MIGTKACLAHVVWDISDLLRKVRGTEARVGEGGLTEHDLTHGLKTEFSRRECGWIGVTVTTTQPFIRMDPSRVSQLVFRSLSPARIRVR